MLRLALLVFLVSLITLGSDAGAQKPPIERLHKDPAVAGKLEPGRSLKGTTPTAYADSQQFAAVWKELLPLVRPAETMQERTNRIFKTSIAPFRNRVDSAEAYQKSVQNVDMTVDEQMLFQMYRRHFNADELKGLVQFFKTPAGKHYFQVQNQIVSSKNAIDQYVTGVVRSTIAPMAKPLPKRLPAVTAIPDSAAAKRPENVKIVRSTSATDSNRVGIH